MSVTALVMAGGKGLRMGRSEKPLIKVLGRPLIDYVLDALSRSEEIGRTIVITSLNTLETTGYIRSLGLEVFVASGEGFLKDLSEYLLSSRVGLYLVVSCDVPTMQPEHFAKTIEVARRAKEKYLMFVVPRPIAAGLSHKPTIVRLGAEEYVPSGLRIILVEGGALPDLSRPLYVVFPYRELGVNVNTPEDIARAEALLTEALKDKDKRMGLTSRRR